VSQRGGVNLGLFVRVWLLLHPMGRRDVLVDCGREHIYIGGILVYQVRGLFGCDLVTTVFGPLTCLCASVRVVRVCPRLYWICSREGVAKLCSWWH